jgi:RNA polymerase subunit RPABC4/transcription elongation factor Spt4
VRLRADGPPAAEALGEAHQNCDPSLPSPKGIGDGTAPLHGAKSASSAWRGGGIVTAPCASTLATNTKAKVARTIGVVATIAARASIIAPPASAITVGCAPRGKGKMENGIQPPRKSTAAGHGPRHGQLGWWCQLQKGAWRAEGDAAALSSSRISRF